MVILALAPSCEMQWASCQPPARVSLGNRRGWRQWRSAGKGSRSPDTRLGPTAPHLPPVPPRCQHRTWGEFASSCLEDISCLNHNYLARQSAVLSDVLLVGIFSQQCEVSWASVIYSSFCLWYPALVVVFSSTQVLPPSSCYDPPRCINEGEKLNL